MAGYKDPCTGREMFADPKPAPRRDTLGVTEWQIERALTQHYCQYVDDPNGPVYFVCHGCPEDPVVRSRERHHAQVIMAMLEPTAWKLLMDGEVWDYSTHRSDCELWWQKVRSEEPEATLDILPATREEMMRWKEM